MVSKEYSYKEFASIMVQIKKIVDTNQLPFPIGFVTAAHNDWVNERWKIDQADREQEYHVRFLPWIETNVYYPKCNPYFDYWFCSVDHSVNALKYKMLLDTTITRFIDGAVDDLTVLSMDIFTDEDFKAHLRDMSLRFLAECAYHSGSSSKLTFHYGTCLTILAQNVYFLLKYYQFTSISSMFEDRFNWPKCYTLAAFTMMGLIQELCK
jgi:hypothetical protein